MLPPTIKISHGWDSRDQFVSRQFVVHIRVSPLQHQFTRIHHALWIELRVEMAHGIQSQRAFFSNEIGLMIGANAVLMADGPALGYDGAARGSFQTLPPAQRLLWVSGNAVDIGCINSRAMGIHLREVGVCMYLLTFLCQACSQRCFDGTGESRNPIPGGGSLHGIHRVAHAPKCIAEVWRQEALLVPYLRNTLWRMGYAVDTVETATT